MTQQTEGGRTLTEHLERVLVIQDRWEKTRAEEIARTRNLINEIPDPLQKKSIFEKAITIFSR